MEKDKEKEYYKNGSIKYDGYWNNDLPEGNGKFIDKKGDYYIGPFKQGLKHGSGIEYYKNGEKKYEGDFVNGLKEGKGVYIYDKGYFAGFLKNDKFHGQGKEFFKVKENYLMKKEFGLKAILKMENWMEKEKDIQMKDNSYKMEIGLTLSQKVLEN